MEEKTQKISHCLRSFSSFWNVHKFFSISSYNSSGKGFTLVEVIIVIAVLGILASSLIVLIDPISQTQKSRDSKRKADLKQIQSALELYRADNGAYPPNGSVRSGQSFSENGTEYLKVVPVDPKNTTPYIYTYNNTGNGYEIYVCAENEDTVDTQDYGGCANSGKRIYYTNP